MNLHSTPRRRPHSPLKVRVKQAALDAVLEAAEQVFAEHGLEAPMEAIAAEAGVAVGTLYNHFENRHALIGALVEVRRTQLMARLDASVAATAALPFRARLDAFVNELVAGLKTHAGFRRAALMSELSPKLKRPCDFIERLAPRLEQVLATGRREKVLKADPRGLQPIFLIGVLQVLMTIVIHEPGRLQLDELGPLVVEQFLEGAAKHTR